MFGLLFRSPYWYDLSNSELGFTVYQCNTEKVGRQPEARTVPRSTLNHASLIRGFRGLVIPRLGPRRCALPNKATIHYPRPPGSATRHILQCMTCIVRACSLWGNIVTMGVHSIVPSLHQPSSSSIRPPMPRTACLIGRGPLQHSFCHGCLYYMHAYQYRAVAGSQRPLSCALGRVPGGSVL